MNTVQDLEAALWDMQLPSDQLDPITKALQAGGRERAIWLLRSVRGEFLSALHGSQDRLFRLDQLIRIPENSRS